MKLIVLSLALSLCCFSLAITIQVAADEATPALATETTTTEPKSDEKAKEAAATEKNAGDEKQHDAKTDDKKADPKEEKKDEKKPRKTHTVKPKRLKVDIALDGTFVADKMTEVALRPKEWSQFEIVEVIKHGSEVRAGDTLIKFDPEKLNKEIADLELEQHLSELTIRKAEEELPRAEKSLTMDAGEAERTNKDVQEDLERYQKIDRPAAVKSAEFILKYYQFQVDYAQEELDQLAKMYEADDLTEDTEEIILTRQHHELELAKFMQDQMKLQVDELLNVRLPRNDIRTKELVDRAALALARAKTALAIDLTRARYDLEQQKQSRAKSVDRLSKLLRDRDLMEIKAPAAGIVYFGECEDGRWSDMSSMISKLEPHNSITADTVMLTILDVRPLHVEAQVSEDNRAALAAGQEAKLVPPTEDTTERIPAKVKSVSVAPVASGKFDVQLDLTKSGDVPAWIVPGTSCKADVNTYDKADALVVPKKALHVDDYDDAQQYVWLVDSKNKEAKPERRNVTVGHRSGEDVEILEGLKAGDVISLDDESEKKDDEPKEE